MPKKKKYTKPAVVKVELKPEQAVLGTCSSGVTSLQSSDPSGVCKWTGPDCKQKTGGGGDSGATS